MLCLAFVAHGFFLVTLAAQADDSNSSSDGAGAASRMTIDTASELTDHFAPSARWLLQQPDERKRAAGLLYLSSPMHGGEESDAVALIDELERAIDTTTDGAALAWLASACRLADITGFCIEVGLDDAIMRHDEANLFSRAALVARPDAATRDRLITETGNTRNYYNQFTGIWFEALANGPAVESLQKPLDKLIGALAISMAYAIPTYGHLSTACDNEAAPGTDLDRACTRILDELVSDGETLIEKSIGVALQAKRAEARGDHESARQLEQRKIYTHARSACISKGLENMLKAGNEAVVREYVQLFVEHGELAAMDRFAKSHEIDCSDPPDPMAEALENYATQLEGGS